MTAPKRRGTLPIRRWLAVVLLFIVVVPTAAMILMAVIFVHTNAIEAEVVAARLEADVGLWHDPQWQRAITDELASEGAYFVLMENGQEIFRSADDPLASNRWGPAGTEIDEFVVPGQDPSRRMFVYTDEIPLSEDRIWLLPAVLALAHLLTLVGAGMFLRRTVLTPLAATEQAAHSVASGDLDISLPSSRVREVAEVNAAFEGMSGALRASLRQQVRLEEERRLFISAIVHDLRTPLFSLRGYLEGLEKGIADSPEKTERYLAVAQSKADALDRLIADLFEYTRLEYLDQAPQREPLDLAALLRDLVDAFSPQAAASGIMLVFDNSSTAPCPVSADRHLLTRAVENLLDNALHFTPAGGHVRVNCQATSNGATFTIADDGPGIAPEDLPHLFAPLYRGDSSRNRRTGGAGLGLTIARRIIRAHGGELTASNGASSGAAFTGTLPVPGAISRS